MMWRLALVLVFVLSAPVLAQTIAGSGGVGIGSGPSAVDPSKNVLDSLLAAVTRLDDIIKAAVLRLDDLRAAYDKVIKSEFRRVDEIQALTSRSETRFADVVREFTTKAAETESKRVDANRAADAAAAKEASTLALSSIKDITAQAFAAQSAATAKSDAAADKRYEQLKSELVGSLKSLDEKVVLLTSANNLSAGKDAGTQTVYGVIGVVIGLLIGGLTLMLTLYRRPPGQAHSTLSSHDLDAIITAVRKPPDRGNVVPG
jgi:hypothetical protein